MNTKSFEVRDTATFIPCIATAMCVKGSGPINYLKERAGYDTKPFFLFGKMTGGEFKYDPEGWGDRTMTTAHKYIAEHWDELEEGAVVDVEFILGETKQKKTPEWEDGFVLEED